jgi:hypothetical protein
MILAARQCVDTSHSTSIFMTRNNTCFADALPSSKVVRLRQSSLNVPNTYCIPMKEMALVFKREIQVDLRTFPPAVRRTCSALIWSLSTLARICLWYLQYHNAESLSNVSNVLTSISHPITTAISAVNYDDRGLSPMQSPSASRNHP